MSDTKGTGKYLLFLRRVRFDFLVQQHTKLSEWTRNLSITGKVVQMQIFRTSFGPVETVFGAGIEKPMVNISPGDSYAY